MRCLLGSAVSPSQLCHITLSQGHIVTHNLPEDCNYCMLTRFALRHKDSSCGHTIQNMETQDTALCSLAAPLRQAWPRYPRRELGGEALPRAGTAGIITGELWAS